MEQSSWREGLWTADRRTGGPFDSVLDELRRRVPGLVVERLMVSHRGDDDNVYFIGDQDGRGRVQMVTWPDGQPQFLIEDSGRVETSDPREAAAIITCEAEQKSGEGDLLSGAWYRR